MLIVNLSDLIMGAIVLIFITITIILALVESIVNKFKKNCFECKYYELNDVASFGDKCWYKCNKTNKINSHSMNDRKHFEKCKYFIKRGNEYEDKKES